ncbi:MAG: TIGR01212 family radical SAM protein [Firmicutes bacterium]|nr:TIGR01212 family radical SAM protein [Bacillota bacterium]
MEKRYYSFGRFLRERFGGRVRKIPIDAGFGCPNRDGTAGTDGCIFCANKAFSPFAEQKIAVAEQIRRFKSSNRPGVRYLAYFQAYTNTYAPVDRLQQLYGEALSDPEVVGLCVATRPDCVPDQVLGLLQSYTDRYMVWIEYGLQSSSDATLRRIKRGHDSGAFADAVERTRNRGIYIGAHVILGLPGESEEEMFETAYFLNALKIDGVKLHHLQVFSGTPLARDYARGRVRTLRAEEYVSLACDFIESLSPQMVIMRLVADVTDDSLLVAPRWEVGKTEVINAIDKELERRGTYQGSRLAGISRRA